LPIHAVNRLINSPLKNTFEMAGIHLGYEQPVRYLVTYWRKFFLAIR
jgi:hypothetical protein